jgi:hypothetical protein
MMTGTVIFTSRYLYPTCLPFFQGMWDFIAYQLYASDE